MNDIKWKDGLPQSRFCRMTANGIIEIKDDPRAWPYEITAAQVNEMRGFSEWVNHLNRKVWFTPPVCTDFVTFVTGLRENAADRWDEWVQRTRNDDTDTVD